MILEKIEFRILWTSGSIPKENDKCPKVKGQKSQEGAANHARRGEGEGGMDGHPAEQGGAA